MKELLYKVHFYNQENKKDFVECFTLNQAQRILNVLGLSWTYTIVKEC